MKSPSTLPGWRGGKKPRWTNMYGIFILGGFPGSSDSKASACNAGDWVQSLGREDPLEKEMATHSSTLAWKIAWTEEDGRL